MNQKECQQLIDVYLEWLRQGLSCEQVDNQFCEFTTPFLDRHNDHLQIYARRENGKLTLSDGGYILADLRMSGLEFKTPKRKGVFNTILAGFGVKTDGKQLFIEASPKDIGQRTHSLVQAMLSVNDMFVMAQASVATFFVEDVKGFLDQNNVRYSPGVKIAGRTGYDHAIDFLIPKSQSRPERIVQVINVPSKNMVTSYLFVLNDTRDVRGESEAYAFLNDQRGVIGVDVTEALQAYGVTPIVWSQRAEHIDALAG